MSDEFCIPAKAEDLLNEDADLPFKIRRLHNFEDASPAEVEEYAEGRFSYKYYLNWSMSCVLAYSRHVHSLVCGGRSTVRYLQPGCLVRFGAGDFRQAVLHYEVRLG